jgi:hypothetical protein
LIPSSGMLTVVISLILNVEILLINYNHALACSYCNLNISYTKTNDVPIDVPFLSVLVYLEKS